MSGGGEGGDMTQLNVMESLILLKFNPKLFFYLESRLQKECELEYSCAICKPRYEDFTSAVSTNKIVIYGRILSDCIPVL